ncbi:unnamed protein product [Closterium sp. NIES-65]|nr:unnamed protein product [Closterium sp. NIES-65]
MEAAWLHLQIVYEYLLWYVISSSETDADDVAKRYIDQEFVLKLLNLFDSEDPRERGYLKTIMHQIYLKFMVHRLFICEAVNKIFYQFIKSERHDGIAELLEFLEDIIKGFVMPVSKEERKQILERVLVPLHKPKCVSMYHQQLSYCITLFVEKDPNLADSVLLGLLEFWALSNNQNELLFLEELEKILELTQELEFHLVMTPLFQQIALCLSSSHFQVRWYGGVSGCDAIRVDVIRWSGSRGCGQVWLPPNYRLSDALRAPLIKLRDFLMPFGAITKFLEGSFNPTMAAIVPQARGAWSNAPIVVEARGPCQGAHALDMGEERVKVLVRECLLQYQTAACAAAGACLGGEVTSARGVAGQGAAVIGAAGPRGARAWGVLEFQAMLFAELEEMEAEEGVRA